MVVERSDDVGASFVAKRLPGNGVLRAISCPSAQVCWAVGEDTALRPVVVTSDDGGRTWRPVRTPTLPAPASGVSCSSPLHCVVLSAPCCDPGMSTALTTFDGGSTWTRSIPPNRGKSGGDMALAAPTLGVVACPTVALCVAGGQYDSGGMNSGFQSVYRSLDGGRTWTPLDVRTISGAGQADILDSSIAAITCPSVSFCRAVVGGGAGVTAVMASVDGGATWTAQPLPGRQLLPGTPQGLSCFDADHCATAGESSLSGYGTIAIDETTNGVTSRQATVAAPQR